MPLPLIPEKYGIRLPHERHCLTAVNFQLIPEVNLCKKCSHIRNEGSLMFLRCRYNETNFPINVSLGLYSFHHQLTRMSQRKRHYLQDRMTQGRHHCSKSRKKKQETTLMKRWRKLLSLLCHRASRIWQTTMHGNANGQTKRRTMMTTTSKKPRLWLAAPKCSFFSLFILLHLIILPTIASLHFLSLAHNKTCSGSCTLSITLLSNGSGCELKRCLLLDKNVCVLYKATRRYLQSAPLFCSDPSLNWNRLAVASFVVC